MFPSPAKRLRAAQRALNMGLPEIATRSRQGAAKWLERAGISRTSAYGVSTTRAAGRLRTAWSERFFGDVAQDVSRRLDPRLVAETSAVIARADRLCNGVIDLLGYRNLNFGNPIDWQFDPVNNRRAPRVHWSRINPLDAATVGDSKVIWELNRHQWLVHLGEAYRLTGDERYARVCAARLREWMRDNPPGIGINWTSSLEVSFRLIAWCWVMHLCRRSEAFAGSLFDDLTDSIAIHAAHVERYLSYYFSPNTHLTGEALGLFYAGVLLHEHNRARRWRTLATRVLSDEITRQVYDDGVYFEQSTYYQRYSIEIYLHFLILAARNHIAVPAQVGQRVQAMLDFLLSVRHPNGAMPQIGDSDGGWLMPLQLRSPDDANGVFAPAAALFDRPDYAWASGAPTLEVLWLLGEQALARFNAIQPRAPEQSASRVFSSGGYAVMRESWRSTANHLVFDVGPLGCPHSGGHGHADLLSVQCAAFGEPLTVDAGTGSYEIAKTRDYFRHTAAHSTVVVDGRSQAEPAGAFRWHGERPRAHLRAWLSTPTHDFADADHDAYCRLADPVVHRRRVVFVKPRYWIVVDDLYGDARHDVELRYQFGDVHLVAGDGAWVHAIAKSGRALAIRAWSAVRLTRDMATGCCEPVRGWWSPEYGQRVPAPALTYGASAALPLRIVSVIVPQQHIASPLPPTSELLSCVALLES
jgi:hypothetical protein